ncbi:MAG TPA: aromatic amino acid hydroxylase, partial [Niabella sp.]|nr:aromatic amino acid hydroxylase [Niabella sp.]
NNTILDRLPQHLRQYIVPQHYEHYTPVDQAVWRYVMRQNYTYLKDVAYYPYIPGLKKAGLSIEHIPDLQNMNDCLKQISWGAVTVNGFIPSQAFMEFQAYRVLIIAADIRQLEHIEYTPAPDIVHESAGHAPIIGEPEYAAYLQFTGEVGTKAMVSQQDQALFEAIRKLAVLKELAGTDEKEILLAEQELSIIQNNMGEPSEMALLARLHWWTVEYGLIGTVDDYKIYGAGLLSSIGESASCMQQEVKKIPYTIDAVNVAYDITKPQPQLFVTPDFQNLVDVLNNFANTLSYRKGGASSLQKAIDCGLVCTAVYSSGLQVSGVFSGNIANNFLQYIQTNGPSALAFRDIELPEHGRTFYRSGFISPVGNLKRTSKPLEDFSLAELKNIGIDIHKPYCFEFDSGTMIQGTVTEIMYRDNKIILFRLFDGVYRNQTSETILFDFRNAFFNMAVGEKIISVFAGAADKDSFEQKSKPPFEMPVSVYSPERLALHELYQQVREIRQGKRTQIELVKIWAAIKLNHPKDWLCALEIVELLISQNLYPETRMEIEHYLHQLKTQNPALEKLILDGLKTIQQIQVWNE